MPSLGRNYNTMGRIIKMSKDISGVTLVELLISVSLIGLVLLTAASLDIAARRFFSDAEEGVAALNDMSVAMEYMVRDLERAIGDFSSYPAFISHTDGACAAYTDGFSVRLDSDEDGQVTGSDAIVDFCYNYDAVNSYYQILRIEGTNTDIIAQKITSFSVVADPSLADPVSEVVIKLQAQDDPGVSGPLIDLQSRAYLRAAPAQ